MTDGPGRAAGIDVRESVSLVPALGHGRPQIAHRLDPRYGAMRPAELLPLIQELAAAIDTSAVDCVLGFPEGGVLPAFAFAQLVGRPLILSTRLRLDLPGGIAFTSCQGTDHFVHGLAPGHRAVIVEDEVTTGQTIASAVRALRSAGVRVDDVGTLLAVDDPAMWRLMEEERVRLHARVRLPGEYRARLGA